MKIIDAWNDLDLEGKFLLGKGIISLAFELAGFALLFWMDWRAGLGVFFLRWAWNLTGLGQKQ